MSGIGLLACLSRAQFGNLMGGANPANVILSGCRVDPSIFTTASTTADIFAGVACKPLIRV
jgi:hypothetical protein